MIKSRFNFKQGYTLVEILLVGAMIVLIVSLLSAFVVFYFRNYSFSFAATQAINAAQTGITTMVREIREARIADNGAWPIESAQDNTFIFYSDVTNDGRVDRVRYFLDGNQLKKGIIEPTQVPVSYPPTAENIFIVTSGVANLATPIFTYYNGDWPADQLNNPLPAIDRLMNTRYVSINLIISTDPDTSIQPYEIKTGVQIRSLKDNL